LSYPALTALSPYTTLFRSSAKELKLFGLSDFLTREYANLSNQIYDQNVALARRRLWAGAGLSLLSSAGYYGAYAYVIYRTVQGADRKSTRLNSSHLVISYA